MSGASRLAFDVDAFERGQVDPQAFDHEAHVYVAWRYLERFALPEALEKFDAALKRLTVQLGIPGKYHATITWFFLLLIAERRSADPDADWARFRNSNPDLFESGLLQRYYRPETLASARARQGFVLPDCREKGSDPFFRASRC